MDPIAHTLVGATLSQTGLRKLTPLATATLVIGANLPDIDGVMSFFGSDASLYYRRGHTHGILAQLLLPLFLTSVILAFDHWVRRRRHPEKSPAKPLHILLLSYLGVISHPFLDWLNTYGVRLLMPFSERWFYGDTLFIIDAWLWLLMSVSVVLAYSQTRWTQLLWVALALATSALVLGASFVPLAAKLIWCLGVVLIFVLRLRKLPQSRQGILALGCLGAFAIYLAAISAGNLSAQKKVDGWVKEHHGENLTDAMIGPLPANPFYREVVAVSATHYYGLRVPVFHNDEIEERFAPVPIPKPDPIIQKALQNPDVRGFVNWMRFPVYEVKKFEEGYLVVIRDLRYVRPDQEDGRGIGKAETWVRF